MRARLLSFGMVVTMGLLLLVSLVVGAALSALNNWGASFFPAGLLVLQALNLTVGFGVTTLLFAVAYRILPRARIAWADVWIGAAVTALLFTFGKYLIGLYLGRAGVSSGFGAAGSLVVILAWVYYSAQMFLLGAEFTWVYAHQLRLAGRPGAAGPPGGSRLRPGRTPSNRDPPDRIFRGSTNLQNAVRFRTLSPGCSL